VAQPIARSKKIILAIGDLHCPFVHKDAIAFLKAVKNRYTVNGKNRIDEVVFLGDEIDGHALSAYSHNPDGFSAGHELDKAIEQLQSFYELFPSAKVCASNHTMRPFRKARESGLPQRLFKEIHDILEAPEDWKWADEWIIDGIQFEHGEGYTGPNGAARSAVANMRPTVIGHIHSSAGILYAANKSSLWWGFNVGCLIDSNAYAFSYAKTIKSKPILGVGVIEEGTPWFLPMILNSSNRWVGTL